MMMQAQWALAAQGLKLAITGMGIHAPGCDGPEAFERALFTAQNVLSPFFSANNGHGELMGRLEQAALAALEDAGRPAGASPQPVGVIFVGAGSNIGPAPSGSRQIAHRRRLEGPTVDLPGDAGALQALPAAATMLAEAGVEAVLLAAGVGGGALALMLRRDADARRSGERVYAVVRSVSVAGAGWSGPDLAECARQSLEQAGEGRDGVGLLEIAGLPAGPAWAAGLRWLARGYPAGEDGPGCAVDRVEGGLLPALLKASFCLYRRQLPGSPEEVGGPSYPLLPGGCFYRAEGSRPWFSAGGAHRSAAVLSAGAGGCAHILLGEGSGAPRRLGGVLEGGNVWLIPLAGDTPAGVLQELEVFAQDLAENGLPDAGRRAFETYRRRETAAYALAVVGRDAAEIQRELDFARRGIPASLEKQADWQTPLGSAFAPRPMGREGGVAFVYPGAFNSYVGMGRDLFRLFPGLHEQIAPVTRDPAAVLCERLLYPRSRSPLSEEDVSRLDAQLAADPISMLNSGSSLSLLHTLVLREVFGVQPQAAFGYSLGENSMMFALGVWTAGDEASARLARSPLFRTRLSGPQNAVREHWGLPALPEHAPFAALWSNYFLMVEPEEVMRALEGEARVYLTHINTPRQVVIGGETAGCLRVIEALKCSFLQAPFDQALHNPAVRSERSQLVEQHSWPVQAVPAARLYSAADYRPLQIERERIAASIGRMLCDCLDFPRLIEQVYRDGARLFIEVGAGSNCTRWIDETLKGVPHLAVSMDRKGVDDLTCIVRLLARLSAHRAPVDLSPLYQDGLPVSPGMACRETGSETGKRRP